jgi:hypothetical protein
VLNVPVPEIILNEPRISALVSQGEAASVAQHVGMGEQGQGSGFAVSFHEQVRATNLHYRRGLRAPLELVSIAGQRKLSRRRPSPASIEREFFFSWTADMINEVYGWKVNSDFTEN